MNDVLERLNNTLIDMSIVPEYVVAMLRDAADEIERLRAEAAMLRDLNMKLMQEYPTIAKDAALSMRERLKNILINSVVDHRTLHLLIEDFDALPLIEEPKP